MRKSTVFFLGLFLPFTALAETYYIDSGSRFRELCPDLKPGDEVVWKNGTYTDHRLVFKANGTAEKPIVLRAETPGGVTIQGLCGFRIWGSHLKVSGFVVKNIAYKDAKDHTPVINFWPESTDCVASDILIDGSSYEPNPEVNRKWVQVAGLRNEVSHCSFIDDKCFGVVLECFPGKLPTGVEPGTPICHKILNNKFVRHQTYFDTDGKSTINGQEIIRIGTSPVSHCHAHCLVQGNWFYECYGERCELVSNKSCFNEYKDNLFEGSIGALVLRHGTDCKVLGNLFIQSKEHPAKNVGGIRVIGPNHLVKDNIMVGMNGRGYYAAMCVMRADSDESLTSGYLPVRNVDIEHNFFIDCRFAIYLNYGNDKTDAEPDDVRFRNNTFICTSNKQHIVYCHFPMQSDGLTWKKNYISPAGLFYQYEFKPDIKKQPELPDHESIAAERRKNAGVRF